MILFSVLLLVMHATAQPLFTKKDPAESGLRFKNVIAETDSLHVMRYEYLYNGHGIGVGDFNNDGLPDVFISGNTVPPVLYQNKGSLRFEDITAAAGIRYNNTWATGVSVVDVNADGLDDIYVCHSGYFQDSMKLCNELLINQGVSNGRPKFKNMAAEYGLDLPGTQSTQAVFFDYDKDGDLDIFLVNHSNHTVNPFLNTKKIRSIPDMRHGNRLLRQDRRGNAISFTDVTAATGIINNALNFGLSATVSDLNDDGWPDLYTTSDYTETDCYYVNNRNGTFTESLKKSFTHVSKYSMGSDIADYNNDGLPDVLTLDMLPEDNHRQKLLKGPDEYDQYHLLIDSGYYHQQMRNMLHLNMGTDGKGNARFSEIGQLAGVSNTDWSWAGLFADFDNDGWKDLFVTNGYLRDFTDLDFLKYTVSTAQMEEAKKGNFNFKTFDLVKKMPANKVSSYLFRNDRHLRFEDATADWGLHELAVSNSAVYADLDNDGDAELIVGRNNEPVALYENHSRDKGGNHFVKFRCKAAGLNPSVVGVKIFVYANGEMQMQERYPVRGYQSSVSGDLLFGMGDAKIVDSIRIIWPSGGINVRNNLHTDSTYLLVEAPSLQRMKDHPPTLFQDISESCGIDFRHVENEFIDFKDEVLLPYQLSREGPALAAADVNADGLTDVFLGGAIGQPGALYMQNVSGSFTRSFQEAWANDAASEDVNAIFFDADKDGDPDLYVVSGGNEYDDGSPEYQDRLYINNGKGLFVKATDALPAMGSSKNAVAVADFDHDGDLDIFVGGRCVAGSFPLPARSFLLENRSISGAIRFEDVTDKIAPWLEVPGMITSATWRDLNGDSLPDLIIAGEWMPILVSLNKNGGLSAPVNIRGSSGMWCALHPVDYDGDGDIDIVAGNAGLNLPFKSENSIPLEMYVTDIDENGRLDPIVCYPVKGKSYPVASRDELLDQVPALKKKFVYYKDYADATVADIIPKQKMNTTQRLTCETLRSSVLINEGDGQFKLDTLPVEMQFSKLNGIIDDDFDNDGLDDILLAGNFYPYNVRIGRNDANPGFMLKGTDKKRFRVCYPAESGLFAGGDVRKMAELRTTAGRSVIVARNDDTVLLFKVNN